MVERPFQRPFQGTIRYCDTDLIGPGGNVMGTVLTGLSNIFSTEEGQVELTDFGYSFGGEVNVMSSGIRTKVRVSTTQIKGMPNGYRIRHRD
ncbi:MAG TPA: hypothetical protein VLB73_03575 [Patescibacteria group bacterium]|nr:hypothetical protein [Patescibacteria group bacterium]